MEEVQGKGSVECVSVSHRFPVICWQRVSKFEIKQIAWHRYVSREMYWIEDRRIIILLTTTAAKAENATTTTTAETALLHELASSEDIDEAVIQRQSSTTCSAAGT